MRIMQLTPGTGHFYCGNCLRDMTLNRALRELGHDVTMLPLYLPVHAEDGAPEVNDRVFLGGINIYLQDRFRWWRRMPAWLTRPLDSPGLLRFSSRRGDMTDAAKHADLTLAMLRGEEGIGGAELDQLLTWMREHDRPDVVCLCNVLLIGLARAIRRALGVPIITTLHGEDAFLDALPQPRREEAWTVLRENVADIDAFTPVSAYYGQRMGERLGLDPARVHVVHNGVALDELDATADAGADTPTIGYLARLCPEKGLDTLVDAFIELKQRGSIERLRLAIAGVMLRPDRAFVESLQGKLRDAGCAGSVTIQPNVSRATKQQFLRRLSVLSVPATYGESFGLYVIEAFACGVPVVQPNHGAFPEIIERSGAGLLCEPDDPAALADGLQRVLTDRELARSLSDAARQSVEEYFNARRMAREFADVCTLVTEATSQTDPQETEAAMQGTTHGA